MDLSRQALILLVEDNHMDVRLTLDAFREVRFQNRIEVVRNGQQAIDYLFGNGEYADRERFPMPDLILLDLNLPGIDGREVLQRVKSTPGMRRLPVVVLTSSADEGDRAMAYDNWVNSYLVKPIQFAGFMDVVQAIGNYWLSLNVSPPESDHAAGAD